MDWFWIIFSFIGGFLIGRIYLLFKKFKRFIDNENKQNKKV